MIKIFTVCCIFMVFLGSFFSASSGEEEIDVDFQGQIMSAELQGVSLRLILEKLQREKGIWFKGDDSVLEERVSIGFKHLPLHEGLRRILSNINHVLVFDGDKGLVGLFILGKGSRGRPPGQGAAIATQRSLPSKPVEVEEDTVDRHPFEAFSDSTPSGNPESKPADTTIGMGNMMSTSISSAPENPFAESDISPSDNPFDGDIAPPSEDPFVVPFGLSPESPEGKD